MSFILQQTAEDNYFETEQITRESFWNLYKPVCDEHLVLHKIREHACYVRQLDLVAIMDNLVVGNIVSTKAFVELSNNQHIEVLCVGPISVHPSHQNKGVGSMLINESIKIAKNMGFPGMVLFGNPDYYKRFGFKNAESFSITTKDGLNFDAFMALEMFDHSLACVKGKFHESSVYTVDTDELLEFDKQFPVKEKKVTDTQLSI